MAHENAHKRAKARIEIGRKRFPDAAGDGSPLEAYVDEEVLAASLREEPSHALSPRELQVVTGVSYGLSNRMIGELYGISTHTAQSHLRRAHFKLKAKNRTHAACEALRRGLIK